MDITPAKPAVLVVPVMPLNHHPLKPLDSGTAPAVSDAPNALPQPVPVFDVLDVTPEGEIAAAQPDATTENPHPRGQIVDIVV